MRRLLPALALLLPACFEPPPPRGEVPAARATARQAPTGALVVTHAGQGSPASRSDGASSAAKAALALLEKGGSATDGAMAAVHLLEDDPRFNAGTGANLRIDGGTIQCDAAIMDDSGRFGAVAGIRGIRHPVDVALAVSNSPHRFLSGPGAQRFADTLALETADLATQNARDKLARGYRQLFEPGPDSPWATFDWRKHWNFATPAPATLEEALERVRAPAAPGQAGTESAETRDTVGAVVRTADGRFAAALSTGGTTLALDGRVGDVPQLGAGLYAGEYGAVAATGKGEAITRERVAARVYSLLREGVHPDAAIRRVMRGVSDEEGVGVIAVSSLGYAAAATTQMAWATEGAHGSLRADSVIW